MKVSEAQKKVLREMGNKKNVLVNADEATPQWWLDGGGAVRGNVAGALIKHGLVKLTGKEGGHPGTLLFTATTRGRVAVFTI